MAVKSGVLLDTHSWLWLRSGTLTAKQGVMDAIRAAADESNWFVSSISLFEIAHAVKRNRLQLDRPLLDWFRSALAWPGPRVVQLTPEIAAASLRLPEDFHGDPGDRILAATAMTEKLAICTHDDALLRFGKQGIFMSHKVRQMKETHAR